MIPDVKASNGVIHAIDAVLVPPSLSQPPAPTQSIVQIAAGNPDFSTLVSLVQKAGLVEAISGPARSPSSRRPTRRSRSSRRRLLRPTRPSSPTPHCSRRCSPTTSSPATSRALRRSAVAQQNGTVKPLEGEHDLALAEGRKADPQRQRHRRHRRHPGDERRDPRNRHRDRPAQPVGLARRPGTQLPSKDGIGSASTPKPGCGAGPDAALLQVRPNTGPAGSGPPKQDLLFDLRIGPLVADCCSQCSCSEAVSYLQALSETGATGLEPATSGVTGRIGCNNARRRTPLNRLLCRQISLHDDSAAHG